MTYAIPNIPAALADSRRKVYVALAIAFVMNVAGRLDPANARGGVTKELRPTFGDINIVGWGVLFIIMTVGVDLYATSELTVAFAFLILVASLLLYGVPAFTHIRTLIESNQPATAANVDGNKRPPDSQP